MKQKSPTKLDGYNHVIKKSELNGFTLTEGIYPPKLRQARHTHEAAHISLILEGGYTERHTKQTWDSRTAILAFRPVGLTHSIDFDDAETRIFTVEVKSRWFDYVGEKPAVLNSPVYFSGSWPVFFATRLFGEYHRGDLTSTLAMEGLVLEMIAAASNDSTTGRERRKSRWLNQARDFLHAEFAGNPTIEEVAKIAGVHPTHLARVFRKQLGCTIGEYLRRLRVESASQKLASTDAPLGEIAAAVGFADQSHFSRTFQTYLGVTPGDYRKIRCPR
ncbi:MAG TPA: AraC family transcriptional regulator [Pyrinomonadaceae bacterium]|jgi:AraC family transcriptional regulator|nr:AraC family transcriptional regulator [Pyrinomonadaceae bacterium]